MIVIAIALLLVAIVIARFAIVVVPKDHTYMAERMGRYVGTLKPGLNFVIPLLDTVRFKFPLTVQSQELSDVVETLDRQRASLASSYRFHVSVPERAAYATADYTSALREFVRGAQKRYAAGQTWDALRDDTRSLEAEVQRGVADVSETFGVKIDEYAVKDLQLA